MSFPVSLFKVENKIIDRIKKLLKYFMHLKKGVPQKPRAIYLRNFYPINDCKAYQTLDRGGDDNNQDIDR